MYTFPYNFPVSDKPKLMKESSMNKNWVPRDERPRKQGN